MKPKGFIGLGRNRFESRAIKESMKKEHEQIQSIAAEIMRRGFQLKEQEGEENKDTSIEEVVGSYFSSGGKQLFEKYSPQKATELLINAMLEGDWLEQSDAASKFESEAA